jgi:Protein of unknown function (DUF2829)
MNFGEAITLLKAGHKMQRANWNGAGQWLYLIPASHWETTRGLETLGGRPWIGIKTVDGSFMPWVASQSDMLSDDWRIYVESGPTWEMASSIDKAELEKKLEKISGKTKSEFVYRKKPTREFSAPYGLKKDGTAKAKPGRKA